MPQNEEMQYGGQAVIEGVMMRSPRFYAVACRAPNGKIVLHTESISQSWIKRAGLLKIPFLRGTFALLDALMLGIKALNFSAKIQTEWTNPKEMAESKDGELRTNEVITASPQMEGWMKAAVVGSMIVGLALGIGLFKVTPIWLAQVFTYFGIEGGLALNLVEGLLKAVIFLLYVLLIGFLKDIHEVFKYHGAEHKAINTLEADEPLTLENARKQTRLHPRCGTSFMIVVLLISIIGFTLVPRMLIEGSIVVNLFLRTILQLALLPLIAGIAYEAIRFAGKHRNNRWIRAVFFPGLMTQYLTTREPREDQIQVALVALQAVLEKEEETKKETPTTMQAV
ncbi:MAG TPA: DUF1385 domain-containing protein [Fimbriimonadales bacterium]|nr:DUF1385 domain-containing protein [Fimbriimonadales bacterium]